MHSTRKSHVTRKAILGGVIAVAALGVLAVTAVATAGGNVIATPQTRGTTISHARVHAGGIKFQTEGRVDVIAGQSFTFSPGGFSGWHTHPGFVLVVVKAGAITLTVGCATHTYTMGQAFYETGTTPVMARNNGTENAVVLATYVVPVGSPARLEANPPTCHGGDQD